MQAENLKIIAFTHKTIGVQNLSRFFLDETERRERLLSLKKSCNLGELLYLGTCNRTEFIFTSEENPDTKFLERFFRAFNPAWTPKDVAFCIRAASVHEGENALRHLFEVASSLDSLVVGEREIITQVRNAYENCRAMGLTGDTLRLVIKKTIETAKEIYSSTNIARHPVSVVSLAYRRLRDLNVPLDAKFLIIGAGTTNSSMARYLKKHGFENFAVFNRTLVNAEKLSAELNGTAYPLEKLAAYKNGFDVIVTCTAASGAIITKEIYDTINGGDTSRKIVIDLAIPNDLDGAILNAYDVNLIAVNNLQNIAEMNLKEREKEMEHCDKIIRESISSFRHLAKERQVERAMSEVPKKVKEIRETAIREVFARDIEKLDPRSKEVLDKILSYVEKKYISVPMKMAKEILMEEAAGEK